MEWTTDKLREEYGLNQPFYLQYWNWIKNIILHGNLGVSFEYFGKSVTSLIMKRLGATLLITFSTLFFSWVVAIPIGIYSATHQYSLFDNIFTFVGFLDLSIPNFLFALVLMWIVYINTGNTVTGIFSERPD